MQKIIQTTKEVLQNYDYLDLWALTSLVKSKWAFEENENKAEDLLNSIILEDIKTGKIKSTFIKVGLEKYALRKESDLENLNSYIKCRLNNFAFWQIDKTDIKYSFEIFWKDIFSENEFLLNNLENLKNIWKINSFTYIANNQIIVWI